MIRRYRTIPKFLQDGIRKPHITWSLDHWNPCPPKMADACYRAASLANQLSSLSASGSEKKSNTLEKSSDAREHYFNEHVHIRYSPRWDVTVQKCQIDTQREARLRCAQFHNVDSTTCIQWLASTACRMLRKKYQSIPPHHLPRYRTAHKGKCLKKGLVMRTTAGGNLEVRIGRNSLWFTIKWTMVMHYARQQYL